MTVDEAYEGVRHQINYCEVCFMGEIKRVRSSLDVFKFYYEKVSGDRRKYWKQTKLTRVHYVLGHRVHHRFLFVRWLLAGVRKYIKDLVRIRKVK